MNNSKKIDKSIVIVNIVIFLVYVLGFFLIPFEKNTTCWITFFFTICSISLSMILCNIAFNSNETIVSKVYGYPIFRIGIIYSLIQLILGIFFCILSNVYDVQFWIPLFIYIVLLGATIIGTIANTSTRKIVEYYDDQLNANTKTFSEFKINISSIVDMVNDAGVKKEILKLDDLLKYSDPVSSDSTKEIENEIRSMLDDLKLQVDNDNKEITFEHIKGIVNKVNERNRICKASK